RHTRLVSDWSSDVCSSDLDELVRLVGRARMHLLGEGLVDSGDEDQELEVPGPQLCLGEAPDRARLRDRMNDRPCERKEHHHRALELELLEPAADAAGALGEP